MPRILSILFVLFNTIFVVSSQVLLADERAADDRYFLVNVSQPEVRSEVFETIKSLQPAGAAGAPQLGVASIVSYLRDPPEHNIAQLQKLLKLAREHKLAVLVQLDGEQWWNNRADLWNWWDPNRPGYDPANAANVEWSGWGEEHALKIAWRNWGHQVRVLPPPNLMSKRYREACHAEMRPLLSEIKRWRDSLSEEERRRFVGVKVGWESAVGMGSHYYPNGNELLDGKPANDPQQPIRPEILPGRGFQPIGYAAASTAGLARDGELSEEHLAEIIRRHLTGLSKAVHDAGFPRAEIFTHCGGWVEGERLYASASNAYSCPGWSFYRYGRNPRNDRTAMAALSASNAPYWAVAEWLPIGARNADQWQSAITNCLSIDRCRYVCAFNWRQIDRNEDAKQGIRDALAKPLRLHVE